MENFEFNYKDSLPKNYNTQRYLFLILGLVYVGNGIVDYFQDDGNEFIFVVWIITGILLLAGTLIDKSVTEKYHLRMDKEQLDAHLAFSNKVKVFWDELEFIKIKPIAAEFKVKGKKSVELSLSQLSYNDVRTVKQKITEFANYKNVEIN